MRWDGTAAAGEGWRRQGMHRDGGRLAGAGQAVLARPGAGRVGRQPASVGSWATGRLLLAGQDELTVPSTSSKPSAEQVQVPEESTQPLLASHTQAEPSRMRLAAHRHCGGWAAEGRRGQRRTGGRQQLGAGAG